MSDLWPYLLRPYWLLVMPLPLWLLWHLWHRRQAIGRWQRLLPPAFHPLLLTRGRLRHSRLPWLLLAVGWLLACLALLGPSWQQVEQPELARDDPLVVLLDLTPNMLAADVPPSRLEQARHKIMDLLRARQNAQTAIVVYAGSAHTLVPLTTDMATTTNLLDVLHPNLMPAPGHRADLAVAEGLRLLDDGARGRGRLLLIGSSLDGPERSAIKALLRESRQRLLILGIGTPQGAPVLNEDGSFLKDDSGAILIPRLDETTLHRFASDVGGRYQAARLDDRDLERLGLLEHRGALQSNDQKQLLDTWLDQGYWLLLPLILLAACGARRGWVFALAWLVVLPPSADAGSLDDLWLRPDQQGMRLLQQQRPAEAAERFTDPRWQGYARYQAGDYAGAAELFAKGTQARDHYNRGNALALDDQLEAALEAYDRALELQPGLQAALHNRALVEEWLRRQREAANADTLQPSETPEKPQTAPLPSGSATSATTGTMTEEDGEAGRDMPSPNIQEQPIPAKETASTPSESDAGAKTVANASLDPEQEQALEQWLRKVPDNPGELLRRKFLHEYRKRQEENQ